MAIINWKSVDTLKTKTTLVIRLIINVLVMCFSFTGFISIPYIILKGHSDSFQIIDGVVITLSLVLFAAMFLGMLYEAKLVVKRMKSHDYGHKG